MSRLRRLVADHYQTPLTLVGFLVLWQLAVMVFGIREFVLPSPVSALQSLLGQRPGASYHWLRNISATLLGIGLSFGVTVFLGIVIAVVVSWTETGSRFFIPIFVFVNSLPIVATAPLILLWFGYGILTNILIAFLVSFFPMVINTSAGLNSVEEDLLDLVRYHKASKWQVFSKIRFPNSLPYIFSGIKIVSTMCVAGVIVGEFIAADRGLAFIIINSQLVMDTPPIFAALILISVIGLGLFGVVSLLERAMMPWHVERTGRG